MILVLTLLSACADGQNPFARKDGADAAAGQDSVVTPATSVKLVDRDVEAPEVFQVTDTGLWDGRPSLGGVWVASPDAVDPERVILRNPSNGKFVIGALFKRERDNPGPSLQISSDAAEALGLLAGQPAKISVTALRREEAPVTTDAAKPLLDAAETVQTETLAQTDDAAKAQTKAPAAQASAIQNVAPQPAATGKTGTNAAPAAETTAAAAIAAAATAKIATGNKAGAGGGQIINKAPDTAAAPTSAPQIPTAPKDAATAQQPSATGGYIQIGLFSVEANAKRAVAMLNAAGVAAQMRQETSKGKVFFSVGAPGDGAVLSKIKAAGFKDAYQTKG
jgi:hypothetical protein